MGISQEKLGEKIGIQRAGMQKIEKKNIEEVTVGQLLGIAKALGKHPMELIDVPTASYSAKVVGAEPDLMKDSATAIQAAARDLNIKLSLPEAMAYTVRLYNHTMKYLSNGKKIAPTEAMAELILQQAV